MDIEKLKEPLGDEMYAELETFVNDLTGQRDEARNESIKGRKGLKEKISTYETQMADMLERLGLESFDDIETLPDAKGAAEASAQYEAKLKRMERQLNEAKQTADEMAGRYKDSLKRGTLADALSAHEFLDRDVVATYVGEKLIWEGDDLLFKQEDGNLVSVKDGVTAFAKSKPHLLKPTGAGGAGVRSTNARGNGGQLTMTRAEFEAMPPAKQMEAAKDGVILQ